MSPVNQTMMLSESGESLRSAGNGNGIETIVRKIFDELPVP